jgi:hypothetical protein
VRLILRVGVFGLAVVAALEELDKATQTLAAVIVEKAMAK